jgi:hypothetical protein
MRGFDAGRDVREAMSREIDIDEVIVGRERVGDARPRVCPAAGTVDEEQRGGVFARAAAALEMPRNAIHVVEFGGGSVRPVGRNSVKHGFLGTGTRK